HLDFHLFNAPFLAGLLFHVLRQFVRFRGTMAPSARQFSATIHTNKAISHDMYHLVFSWDVPTRKPCSGQFFTLRVSELTQPLLRRPFAYSGFNPVTNTASCIYLKRGVATQLLTSRQPGDRVDIIGPLGNGFTFDDQSGSTIVVAGGVGLGPMIFCAEQLMRSGKKVTFIFGCRSSNHLPQVHFRQVVTASTVICTDDGSYGFHGTTIDYLKTLGSEITAASVLYACGPTPMLAGCASFAASSGIPCFVSMEQTMACGVGACMGCVVRRSDGVSFARVCKDGPVFNAQEIAWTCE
ncbi:MAG: dihydroorotate dehydrogenase electron transfer subunit, partial [Chitinivibrionales bacterium]|nr:dihydroorotate dehydrogenase electron transfer subunit [Chitinivibrionales bacterium]